VTLAKSAKLAGIDASVFPRRLSVELSVYILNFLDAPHLLALHLTHKQAHVFISNVYAFCMASVRVNGRADSGNNSSKFIDRLLSRTQNLTALSTQRLFTDLERTALVRNRSTLRKMVWSPPETLHSPTSERFQQTLDAIKTCNSLTDLQLFCAAAGPVHDRET